MRLFGKFDITFVKVLQPLPDSIVDGTFRIISVLIRFAGFNTGQNFYAVINIVNRVNMKFSFVNGIQDVFAQPQVLYDGTGDNHGPGLR